MNLEQIMQQIDVLYSNQKVEEVEALLLSKIAEFKNNNQVFERISLMNELLGIYREKGDPQKGTTCCEDLLSIFHENNFNKDDNYATTLLNIATAQRSFKNYDVAIKCYNQCEEIYNNLIDKKDYRFACLYNNLSLLYVELQEYDKAINFLENSIEILTTHNGVDVQIATAYTTLSQIYIQLDNINLAQEHISRASKIFEINPDYHYSATLSTYAQIEYILENYEKSAELYKKALSEIEKYIGKTENYKLLEQNLKQVESKINNSNNNFSNIKGLELSKDFYNEFGKPMIQAKFPEYENRIAIGLVGEGSECFGFDDEYSKDHDFGAGFCMWLTQDDYSKIGESLQVEYDKLPKTYKGIERNQVYNINNNNINSNNRVGVFSIGDFYKSLIEFSYFPQTSDEWLFLKDYQLANATNGQIFKDDLGEFTSIRKVLFKHYPTDVLIKKIAYELHLVCQTGQYNFVRTLKRGDKFTSRLILSKFTEHTINLVHLLNKKYCPFYKWSYQSFKKLSILGNLSEQFELLENIELTYNNHEKFSTIIDHIAKNILFELKNQSLLSNVTQNYYLDFYLQDILSNAKRFEELAEKIELVKKIVVLEWNAFDKVKGAEGRATCQNDYETFNIMRSSQFLSWNNVLLKSYLQDFENASSSGRNMITEKYAFMMKSTDVENYNLIKDFLPIISPEHTSLIEKIVVLQLDLVHDLEKKYPKLVNNGRILNSNSDTLYDTSYETYLRGELSTYTYNTVKLYYDFIESNKNHNINIVKLCLENTARLYGYKDLQTAESKL